VTPKKTRKGRPPAPAGGRSVKKNLLASLKVTQVDWKDTATLRVFLSERGKIRSRNVTGLTVQQQRQVAAAIKNAREMALLPYAGHAGGAGAKS
jgi:small subunit ribosomal protein S18